MGRQDSLTAPLGREIVGAVVGGGHSQFTSEASLVDVVLRLFHQTFIPSWLEGLLLLTHGGSDFLGQLFLGSCDATAWSRLGESSSNIPINI